jgi:tight adherence protein B
VRVSTGAAGWSALAAGCAAAALAPGWVGARVERAASFRRRRRDEIAAADALPAVARRLAVEVGAGRTLVRALRAAAADAPAPLGAALAETAARLAAGGSAWTVLGHALPENGGCRLLAASLELQGRAGGDLPRLLRSLASALDDRAQVEAELRALTAQARFSAIVVPLLPFGALGLLAAIEPRGVELLLTTPAGLAVVVVAALLDVTGALAIRRLLASHV